MVVVAVKKGWPLFQLDVNNAFLHSDLDEEVYIKIPPVLSTDCPPLFRIKDLGTLNHFLGIEVCHTPTGLLLHQRKFIQDLLQEYKCDIVSLVTCPLDHSVKLKSDVGNLLPNPASYRTLEGKLNFLTHPKPDLCFVVEHLSQYLQNPTQSHMKVALHLLRYLKGLADIGVSFSNSPNFSMSAYYDSNWASCPDTRRSFTGFYVILGGSLISGKSKKQHVISLSLVEAEYRSVSKVVAELVWLIKLHTDFIVIVSTRVPVYYDN
ncbi:uncharacterized mitochondrial protein AtMg00810-like [Lycium barbarum]|uniref:uncharacterized mitochondrial protein AtMg00810-like n=1 Tax=Lycium barbarum TaxID=112863 RepID=UPI00293E9CE6|nr:uncharacterized mitochondrial protein AtMg00810-like [Lycium barbarum]